MDSSSAICDICQRRIGDMYRLRNFVRCCRDGFFFHIKCVERNTRSGNEYISGCDCRRRFQRRNFLIIFTAYHTRIVAEIDRIMSMMIENRSPDLLTALVNERDSLNAVFPNLRPPPPPPPPPPPQGHQNMRM